MLSDILLALFGFLVLVAALHVASQYIMKDYQKKREKLELEKENP